MRWLLAAVLVLLLAAAAPAGASGGRCDTSFPGWAGSSPMIGGESVMSEGEFVYQDYLYDDLGPAVGDASAKRSDAGVRSDTRKNGVGTYEYPSNEARYGANAADISQFRVRRDGENVRFLVVLNTMLAPDAAVVGIALGDTGDARRAWPLGAGIQTPGTKHVITAWGTGAAFDDKPVESVGGTVHADTERNTIEVSVPSALVGSAFRTYVGAGLWDPQGKRWMPVGETRSATTPSGGDGQHPNVFNVAFRRDEANRFSGAPHFYTSNWWWELSQAAALAEGKIDKYFADVDLAAPDTSERVLTGHHQRVYCSEARTIAPDEGIREAGVTTNWTPNPVAVWRTNFIGPWQTYSVYVPPKVERMTVLLHGSGISLFGIGTPGIQKDLGDANNSILVDPLARGVSNGFSDQAELSVLEAMEDAAKHYPVDPDRTVLGGVSMGGVGTYRLLGLHPDRFAGGLVWSGCAGSPGYCTSLTQAPADLFENYRNLDVFLNHDALDYLLPVYMAVDADTRLETLGYPHRLAVYPAAEHTGFYYWDDYGIQGDFARGLRVDRNPVHVTYKTSESWWRPQISPKLVYDHAYWVSGMRTRDKSQGDKAFGSVDAITHGLGRAEYTTARMQPGVVAGGEREPHDCQFVGPSGRPACMSHTMSGREKVAGAAAERGNSFTTTLKNLGRASFDLDRMGLTTHAPLIATIATDGPSAVTLLGAGPVNVAGAQAERHGQDVTVLLDAPGTYTVTLTRPNAAR